MRSARLFLSVLLLLLVPSVSVAFDASLSWIDDVTNEESWVVRRSVDGAAPVDLATLPADSISYNDLNIPVDAVITYYVVPVNLFGEDPTPPSGTTETKPPDSSATITITVQ